MRLAALALVAACHGSSTPAPLPTPSLSPSPTPPSKLVTIDPTGIGFDDLVFANHKVLAPAGKTGNLVLIDPDTGSTESKRVAAAIEAYRPGRHDVGITSVAATPIRIVATDRTSKTLVALDSGKSVPLAAEPDYVRFIEATDDLWVTEPDAAQIEIIHTSRFPNDPPFLKLATFAVPGGPESLVVSASRKMAYANLWHAKSVEIDVGTYAITRTFDSGCDKTRGIALDDVGGGLFVACNDGRVVRIDLASGKIAENRTSLRPRGARQHAHGLRRQARGRENGSGPERRPLRRRGRPRPSVDLRSRPRKPRRFLGKPLIWERP